MLTREEAFDLVKRHVTKKTIIYHMLAVEAAMRSVAKYLNEDEEVWGLTGLLHDLDYDKTETTPERHTMVSEEILKEGVPEEVKRAIKTHNFNYTKVQPETKMEKALVACDAISGLLVACALVMPSKKLEEVRVETVAKKFKDKDFARGADRRRIELCEEIGIPKEKFFEVTLNGLKTIASELGL